VTIKLFDLAGAEPELRFSPYCWRTKLALAHKGLAAETIPWRFVEKDAIAMSGQGRVPVLLDGDKIISDSWTIAEYLEDTYPDRPSLFGSAQARRVTRFINSWADIVVNAALARLLLTDIYAHLHEKDRVYFRESREKRFGMPLEQVSADRDTRIAGFHQRPGTCPRCPHQAALSRRRPTALCGLHPVRIFHVGPQHQQLSGVDFG